MLRTNLYVMFGIEKAVVLHMPAGSNCRLFEVVLTSLLVSGTASQYWRRRPCLSPFVAGIDLKRVKGIGENLVIAFSSVILAAMHRASPSFRS